MAIRVKVSEWGNSLAIRLPKIVVKQLGLKAGAEAELELFGDGVRVVRAPDRLSARKTLEEMVSEARAILAAGGRAPEPVDWGPDRGAERWYDSEDRDGSPK
ncbi:AbrB/MazE/SpoVT family DNA-binding domain-containing protein [bacterium]|nr:AbrB/MazE/SpoVT family DNA-binding domain-containing protein [bacterium]